MPPKKKTGLEDFPDQASSDLSDFPDQTPAGAPPGFIKYNAPPTQPESEKGWMQKFEESPINSEPLSDRLRYHGHLLLDPDIANVIDDPRNRREDDWKIPGTNATWKSLIAGSVEYPTRLVRSLTTPANLALLLTGIGEAKALKYGMPTIAEPLGTLAKIGAAGYGASSAYGGYQAAKRGDVMGAVEGATGAALGALGTGLPELATAEGRAPNPTPHTLNEPLSPRGPTGEAELWPPPDSSYDRGIGPRRLMPPPMRPIPPPPPDAPLPFQGGAEPPINIPPGWLPFQNIPAPPSPEPEPAQEMPTETGTLDFDTPPDETQIPLPLGAYRSPAGRFTRTGPSAPPRVRPFLEEPLQDTLGFTDQELQDFGHPFPEFDPSVTEPNQRTTPPPVPEQPVAPPEEPPEPTPVSTAPPVVEPPVAAPPPPRVSARVQQIMQERGVSVEEARQIAAQEFQARPSYPGVQVVNGRERVTLANWTNADIELWKSRGFVPGGVDPNSNQIFWVKKARGPQAPPPVSPVTPQEAASRGAMGTGDISLSGSVATIPSNQVTPAVMARMAQRGFEPVQEVNGNTIFKRTSGNAATGPEAGALMIGSEAPAAPDMSADLQHRALGAIDADVVPNDTVDTLRQRNRLESIGAVTPELVQPEDLSQYGKDMAPKKPLKERIKEMTDRVLNSSEVGAIGDIKRLVVQEEARRQGLSESQIEARYRTADVNEIDNNRDPYELENIIAFWRVAAQEANAGNPNATYYERTHANQMLSRAINRSRSIRTSSDPNIREIQDAPDFNAAYAIFNRYRDISNSPSSSPDQVRDAENMYRLALARMGELNGTAAPTETTRTGFRDKGNRIDTEYDLNLQQIHDTDNFIDMGDLEDHWRNKLQELQADPSANPVILRRTAELYDAARARSLEIQRELDAQNGTPTPPADTQTTDAAAQLSRLRDVRNQNDSNAATRTEGMWERQVNYLQSDPNHDPNELSRAHEMLRAARERTSDLWHSGPSLPAGLGGVGGSTTDVRLIEAATNLEQLVDLEGMWHERWENAPIGSSEREYANDMANLAGDRVRTMQGNENQPFDFQPLSGSSPSVVSAAAAAQSRFDAVRADELEIDRASTIQDAEDLSSRWSSERFNHDVRSPERQHATNMMDRADRRLSDLRNNPPTPRGVGIVFTGSNPAQFDYDPETGIGKLVPGTGIPSAKDNAAAGQPQGWTPSQTGPEDPELTRRRQEAKQRRIARQRAAGSNAVQGVDIDDARAALGVPNPPVRLGLQPKHKGRISIAPEAHTRASAGAYSGVQVAGGSSLDMNRRNSWDQYSDDHIDHLNKLDTNGNLIVTGEPGLTITQPGGAYENAVPGYENGRQGRGKRYELLYRDKTGKIIGRLEIVEDGYSGVRQIPSLTAKRFNGYDHNSGFNPEAGKGVREMLWTALDMNAGEPMGSISEFTGRLIASMGKYARDQRGSFKFGKGMQDIKYLKTAQGQAEASFDPASKAGRQMVSEDMLNDMSDDDLLNMVANSNFIGNQRGSIPLPSRESVGRAIGNLFKEGDRKEPSTFEEAMALPGAAMTGGDVSMPLRQGLPLAFTPEWRRALIPMFKSFFSADIAGQIDEQVRSNPIHQERYNPITDKEMPSVADEMGITLIKNGRVSASELSLGSNWIENGGTIPYLSKGYRSSVGKVYRASNRAAATFLNLLRTQTAEKLLNAAKGMATQAADTGRAPKPGVLGGVQAPDWMGGGRIGFSKNYTPEEAADLNPYNNKKLAREIGDFVNTATGRAPLKTVLFPHEAAPQLSLEWAVKPLKYTIFSPRGLATKVRMMNPFTYTMASPFVRKQYLKAALSAAAAWYTMNKLIKGYAAATGHDDVEVSDDTNSSEYGKSRIGNVRMDPGAGFQQLLVLYSRLLTGEETTSASANPIELGQGYRPPTRRSIAIDFMANKMNPVAKYINDFANASTNQPMHVGDRTIQLFTSLVMGDLYAIAQEDPSLVPGLAPPIMMGMGSQVYDRGDSEGKFISPENDWLFTGGGNIKNLWPGNWGAEDQ